MRGIRMPSEGELPPGSHRKFLTEVFQMYRAAGRPPLRDIVAQANRMNLNGSASQETIRRMLKGLVIPQRWETAYAVYAPLCVLADINPDDLYWDDEGDYEVTHKDLLKRLWSAAFDADASDLPHPTQRTKVAPSLPPGQDPWAKGLSLDDEPPF